MTLGRFLKVPTRFAAAAQLRMPRIDISDGARALARIMVDAKATRFLHPSDYNASSRTVVDRVDGSLYSASDPFGNAASTTTIGSGPALQFTTTAGAASNTRRLVGSSQRAAGSFSVALVWQVDASQTTQGSAPALFASDPVAAFYLDGTLRFTMDGNSAANTGIGAGAHVGVLSYDATSGTAVWVNDAGVVTVKASVSPPAAGKVWNYAGNFADGRDIEARMGIFEVNALPLHDGTVAVGAVAPAAKSLIDALKQMYGL